MDNNEEKAPEFNISAAVVKQLGEELVTDEVTAIMELVKNSYDADSPWVKIEVNTKDIVDDPSYHYKGTKGYILIEDQGFGMSESDIRKGWMYISVSGKREMKALGNRTPKGRTPLGDKGLGRLSTQRLGSRLEMFTGKKNEEKNKHVAFDWNEFKESVPLSDVPIYFKNDLPKQVGCEGTKLIISGLRNAEGWEGKEGDKFIGQLSQLIFPFKERRVFNVFLKINGKPIDLDEVSENVRKNAVSKFSFVLKETTLTIKGEVKTQKLIGSTKPDDVSFYENYVIPDAGKDFYTFLVDPAINKQGYLNDAKYLGKRGTLYTFETIIDIEKDITGLAFEEVVEDEKVEIEQDIREDKLKLVTVEIPENANDEKRVIALPGNFEGEIDDFYFQETDAITSAFDTLSEFRRIVHNQVGIRVFRDGFGVKPYGINGQDWLQLSGGQTSGSSFYGLRPGNVIGFVSITAEYNGKLKEKTDREGFAETPHSRNFFLIMDKVVDAINNKLEATKRSYNSYKSTKREQTTGVDSVTDSFEKIKQTASKAKAVKSKVASLIIKVDEAAKRFSDRKKTTREKEIDELFEQILAILNDAKSLLNEVETILGEAQKFEHYQEYLKPEVDALQNQLKEFSELAGLGLTAEALSHELSNIVDRVVEETDRINKKIKGKSAVDGTSVGIYVEYVRSASRAFRKQLSHLAPSLKYVRESKEKIAVKAFLAELKDYYSERLMSEIQFEAINHGHDFLLKMNKGKLTQIIDNIILNSIYWLRVKKNSDPRFKPIICVDVREPFIRIYDNGNGIDPNLQDRIFQPFVTGKSKKEGRGLGLFIVKQLLETIGSEITLLEDRNQFGRRYIFQINLSNVIE